jgi:hypothetical protein
MIDVVERTPLMGFGTTGYIQRLHGQTLVVVGAIYVGYMRPVCRFWYRRRCFAWVGHWIFHPVSYVVPSSTRTRLEEYVPPPTWVPHRQAEGRDVG